MKAFNFLSIYGASWTTSMRQRFNIIIHRCLFLQGQFFFAVTWSIGAACDHDGRTKFDAFLKELSLGKIEAHPIPKCIGKMDLPYPNEGTIYDYMYDVSTNAEYQQ